MKNKCNSSVQISYKSSLHLRLVWPNRIQTCLSSIGMQNIFLHGNISPRSTTNLIFHQNSFAELNRENSKLRTYKFLKTEIGREPYLKNIKNIQDRILLTKFRLSNHRLMIEKGRHLKIPRKLRYCPFCHGSIEDEIHFLIKCKCFTTHRNTIYGNITKGKVLENFSVKSDMEKFKFLLTHSRILQFTAKYLRIYYS